MLYCGEGIDGNANALCRVQRLAGWKLELREVNVMKVDFKLLWELHQEYPDYTVGELIGYLEMNDVPMTDAVRKLGVCAGILYE